MLCAGANPHTAVPLIQIRNAAGRQAFDLNQVCVIAADVQSSRNALKGDIVLKNILVPTDGSGASRNAARYAVALAKATGAKITALHVAPTHKFEVYEDYVPPDFMMPSDYAAKAKKVSQRHLDIVRKLAESAGVRFRGEYTLGDSPAEAIVRAARKYGCDGIVMGSHGRTGMQRLLLGSQTRKVLAASKVPVVVVP